MMDDLPVLGEGTDTVFYANGWIKISSMANRDEEWIQTDTPVEVTQ